MQAKTHIGVCTATSTKKGKKRRKNHTNFPKGRQADRKHYLLPQVLPW